MAGLFGGLRPVAVGVGTVWFVLVMVEPIWADPTVELLDKLQKRREEVKTLYHATKTASREGDLVRETDAQIWEQRDGKTCKVRRVAKVKTLQKDKQPANGVETLTVIDGKHEWRQMPVGEQLMVFKAAASEYGALDDVRAVMSSGTPRIKGRESIHREPCVVLEVISGGKSDRFRATFWISEPYGVVLKSAVTRADRSSAETDTVEFRVNEPMADDTFVYQPPEGATVLDTGTIGKPPDEAKP